MPRSTSEVKMLCYSASPNRYFEREADAVAEIYDGFFFPLGDWDKGVLRLEEPGATRENGFRPSLARSLESLTAEGAGENFLTVC